MTIRGGGRPKPTMVLTPFLRMGPPPRSFAADAHDCIMVRPPLNLPNTRLWRDDPRPMASSPLIVDARLSPSNCARGSGQRSVCSGNRDGWSARPSQQGDRAASAACDTPKAGSKNASSQVRNDGHGQVESHLGRNRLTSDAPYKACSGFTRVTARWIAQPPKAAFVTRLQPSQLPDQTARQLPEQSTTLRVEPSSTGDTRRRGALGNAGSKGRGGEFRCHRNPRSEPRL